MELLKITMSTVPPEISCGLKITLSTISTVPPEIMFAHINVQKRKRLLKQKANYGEKQKAVC